MTPQAPSRPVVAAKAAKAAADLTPAQLDAVIGGAGLTKAGVGTLQFGSTTSYAGQTTVSQGVLI